MEQIVAVVKQHDMGLPAGDSARKLGSAEQTFSRWKKPYGGLEATERRELTQLRAEKTKLKQLVAELSLDKAMFAEDYRSHTEWTEEGEQRVQGLKGQDNPSSALPSIWWLRIPARDGQGAVGIVPMQEKGRWGERMRAILELWEPLQGSVVDHDANFLALRKMLDSLLESHFRGHDFGAPRTGRALIEEMKADETVDQLDSIGSETLRLTFDRFLRDHPDLALARIRVQFEGPYTESQVIELGRDVAENVVRFRDAFRSFIKAECGPYF